MRELRHRDYLLGHKPAITRNKASAGDESAQVQSEHRGEVAPEQAGRRLLFQKTVEFDSKMSSDAPLVSIITPAYNRGPFLDETIQSILSQDYPHIEYIVLDDGSTDDTMKILEKYKDDIMVESHPNMGETRTVNKGIGMAKGQIVCVVNSDDPLRPLAISSAVEFLSQYPDAMVAYPDWHEIGPKSEVLKEIRLPRYDIQSMLLSMNIALGPGVFIRRRVFDLIGMRDPALRYAADLDFWFRVALLGPLVHIPRVLATHRVHESAASTSDRGAQMADELVEVITRYCDHADLPAELRGLRKRILATAHCTSVFRSGADRSSAIRHFSRAVGIYPRILMNLRFGVPSLIYLISPESETRIRKIWKSLFQRSRPKGVHDLRAH